MIGERVRERRREQDLIVARTAQMGVAKMKHRVLMKTQSLKATLLQTEERETLSRRLILMNDSKRKSAGTREPWHRQKL